MILFYKKNRTRAVAFAGMVGLSVYGLLGAHVALAAGGSSFRDIVTSIIHYISSRVFPLIVGITVLTFFFNLVFFIGSMNNPTEREKFRSYTVNALLGIFIMLAVWGIVGILTQTVFKTNPIIPQLPTSD